MKRYYCTYFDRNYLAKGLAAIESLVSCETADLQVFAVCMDEITRIILNTLDRPYITPLPFHLIENGDAPLLETKKERSLVEYYWTTTPTIILRLLESHPEIDILTYMDADLFFFNDPQPVFDELGAGAVLIHEHRFSPHLQSLARDNGRFNVGLLSFRNTEEGLTVLRWWRERCIEWCFWRSEDGKMGDQMYLNDWPERFSKVVVLKHAGSGVAPWNHSQYRFTRDSAGRILADDLPLIFYHFHSFGFSDPEHFFPHHPHYGFSIDALRLCFLAYHHALDEVYQCLAAIVPGFNFGKAEIGHKQDHAILAVADAKAAVGASLRRIDSRWALVDLREKLNAMEASLPVNEQTPVPIWPEGQPVHGPNDLLLALGKQPICMEIETLYVIGAFRFEEAPLFKQIFGRLKHIVLFEPIPQLFQFLSQQFGQQPDITVLPFAVSDFDGRAIFHLTNNWQSSSLLALGHHRDVFPHVKESGAIEVDCCRLDTVIESHRLPAPDMLFIDAQGAELRILSALSHKMRGKLKLIYTEASTQELYAGSGTLSDIRKELAPAFHFCGFAPTRNDIPMHGNAIFVHKKFANSIALAITSQTSDRIIDKPCAGLNVDGLTAEQRQSLAATAKALRKAPNDRPAMLKMSSLLEQTGNFKQAGILLMRLLTMEPHNPTVQESLAALAVRAQGAGDFDSARDCCLSLLALDPGNKKVQASWEALRDTNAAKQVVRVKTCASRDYRVAAIVSTYQSEAFMAECLSNILQQSIADQIEIVVVDAASPENESDIIAAYRQRHPNITYIRTQGRIGVYTAWNIAIQHSTAPYCISISTNDQLGSTACERLARELDRHADVGLVFGDTYLTHQSHETFQNNTHYDTYQWGAYSYARHLEAGYSIGPHPMWRRSVHAAIGYFDERFVADGDQEFWLRLGAAFPIRHIDMFTGLQWITPQSLSGKGSTPLLELSFIKSMYRRSRPGTHNHGGRSEEPDPKIGRDRAGEKKSASATIVIVTFNSAATIQSCLESVQKALRPSDEVRIVDNDSRDQTAELVHQCVAGDHRFRLIRNADNIGYAAAANTGAADTDAQYIVFLNPDTVVTGDWLDRMIFHAASPEVAAVGPVSNCVAGLQKAEYYLPADFAAHREAGGLADALWQQNRRQSLATRLLVGFCLLVKREAFERAGGMDQNLFLGNDDLDLCWRLRLAGYQLRVAKDTFVFHKGQESFASVPKLRTGRLVQESTDYLFYKLVRHYGLNEVPDARRLWGMDWFHPQVAFEVDLPLTSVVVLTYNQLEYTKKCIDSLFVHTRSAFELIVVDNGSTDGTVEYLASLTRRQTACIRIETIINANNEGFARGCNQGLAVARGEQLLLLNNDVVVTRGWLQRLSAVLCKDPALGLAGPMTNYVSGPQFVKDPGYDVKQLDGLDRYAEIQAGRYAGRYVQSWRLAGFCLLIRRTVVEKIGGLDTRFAAGNFEDDDFCFRAHLAGYRGAIVQDCYVHHFGGRTFQGNHIDFDHHMARNWELFKQKWNMPPDMPLMGEYRINLPAKGFDPVEHCIPLQTPPQAITDPSEPAPQSDASMITTNELQATGLAENETSIKTPLGGKPMSLFDQVFEAVHKNFTAAQKPAAIWITERLIEAGYANAQAHHQLGMWYYQDSRFDEAQAQLQHAERLSPQNAVYAKDLGDFYHVVRGDGHSALSFYEKAAAGMPYDRELLLTIGHLYTGRQEFKQAHEYYGRVLKLDPANMQVRTYMEKISAQLKKTAPALSPQEIYQQAQAKVRQKDPDGAIDALERLLSMDPQHAQAHNDLGVLYYEKGLKDKVLAHYEAANRLAPESGLFQKNLADFYYIECGDIEKALAKYVQALTLDPKDVECLMSTGQICMRLERVTDALVFFNRVLEIEPWNNDAFSLVQQLESGQQAAPSQPAPLNADGLYAAAREKAERGDPRGAIRDLKQIVAQAPEHGTAYNDLGVLHYNLGQKEEALKYYQQSVQIAPGNPTFLKNLADYYFVEQGRAEEALKIYVKILEEDNEDVDCLFATGSICAVLGKNEDARTFFERVLEIQPWHAQARQELERIENINEHDLDHGLAAFGKRMAL